MGIIIEPRLDHNFGKDGKGVASFFPYKVDKGWNAFISGAYPYETRADYPLKGGKAQGMGWDWPNQKRFEGPWKPWVRKSTDNFHSPAVCRESYRIQITQRNLHSDV